MYFNNKVRPLSEVAKVARSLRGAHVPEHKTASKGIVHCHGVFDLLHIGHIRYLQKAKNLGDVLIVTVTPDRFVNKGPHRPAFPEQLRAEAIAALDCVDYVAINEWPTAVETIRLLKPDVYAKGAEFRDNQTPEILLEEEVACSVGAEVAFIEEVTSSSSTLLNRHLSVFPPEVDLYLEEFRKRHSAEEVLEWLQRASTLRPLVVGEAIIDEYVFTEGMGKSTKDPVLAVLQQSVDARLGGTLAVANHLAGLCCEAGLVTQLGETERREDLIVRGLRGNTKPYFLTKSDSPTVHKRRIVDAYSGNKLLEIYLMDDRLTAQGDEVVLMETLRCALDQWDLILVADYGHGMLTPQAIKLLCDTAPYLALNVQSNAGNRGFNPVSKYCRADYVCLAEYEVAMETRQRDGSLHDRLLQVTQRIDCPRFTVTRGKQGSLHYDPKSGFVEAPSLATRVEDRVGAGDAVLAITSLLTFLGAPWDLVAFVGNLAGAQMVAGLGNRTTLEKLALSRHITSLLK